MKVGSEVMGRARTSDVAGVSGVLRRGGGMTNWGSELIGLAIAEVVNARSLLLASIGMLVGTGGDDALDAAGSSKAFGLNESAGVGAAGASELRDDGGVVDSGL